MSREKHWALVTGAASGIGKAVAVDLAAQGYNLLLADMNADGLSELKAELGGFAVSVSLKVLDLADLSALDGFCDEIECFDGKLDYAFLNAGVVTPGDVLALDRARLTRDVDVNLKSAMWLNQACARKMRSQGSGHIINTASMAALVSLKGAASYSASKFGLRGFLIALREELRQNGVFVSMILPSAIDTPMLRYEAKNGGSALNFLSEPSSVEDVVRVFNKAQKSKKLEYFIPYSDSLMGRLVCIFPGILGRFYSILSKLGERGRKRFLRGIDS